jgi:hypothetical protein
MLADFYQRTSQLLAYLRADDATARWNRFSIVDVYLVTPP